MNINSIQMIPIDFLSEKYGVDEKTFPLHGGRDNSDY
jgi:hypothetical protein